MKDKYENLRKLQNQRYAVQELRAPVEGYLRWMLIYTTKIEGSDGFDFQDHVMTHPTREACMFDLLNAIENGEEVCWFNLFEAKDYIQTFYNIDHTDKEVREEFKSDLKNVERYEGTRKTFTLTQEIEDYIAEEIAHTKWLEQGCRLDKEGYMIYEL